MSETELENLTSQVAKLTEQRDRARSLAAILENELTTAEEMVAKLTRKLAVAEGKELE